MAISTAVIFTLCWHLLSPVDAAVKINTPALSRSDGCAKCASNKVGKYSCCARGGAWFKNCGDAGDTHFNHTWVEGIQACKHLEASFSMNSSLQVMLDHAGTIFRSISTAQSRNEARNHTNNTRPSVVSDGGSADKHCVHLGKFFVFICFLCSIVQQQTKFHSSYRCIG